MSQLNSRPTYILGLSAYYHDSAAVLLQNGDIFAAAQEERFTRKKHDPAFPKHAINYCLSEAQISLDQVSHVVFYDKPLVKFERLLESYLAYAPRGLRSLLVAMPVWLKEKLFLKQTLKKELTSLLPKNVGAVKIPSLLFTEHHQAHAASAYYASPYDNAAVLCMDGVGEWAATTLWHGKDNELSLLWEQDFPHSLGLLYSAFTYYTGFKVNSGEYKLMGLAPYGEPKYVDLIRDNLIDLRDDGTFRLNMEYFNFVTGLTMTNDKFAKLFGSPARAKESQISQKDMDIARSIQVVTEDIVLKLVRTAKKETAAESLCLAGGVALNCVANGRILREGPFNNVWIQPAAGDAGGALGAALACWYQYLEKPRAAANQLDAMKGSYLGPSFKANDIELALAKLGAVFTRFTHDDMNSYLVKILEQEHVVGWFQGRMEFGPRALGARSIIGDARSPKMQSVMNLKIKFRESFRPFAPAILADDVNEYFDLDSASPYMLLVAGVKDKHRLKSQDSESAFGLAKLMQQRSKIPAITHVDYSARIQTVHKETNPHFHDLLSKFKSTTGCPILVNTSFNVRGEPIVNSIEDAYRCFMRTNMDYLVIENYLMAKELQPTHADDESWKQEFELD